MTLPARLAETLRQPATLVIAVSGGVDSLCLSAVAAIARRGMDLTLCHAVSPAVPKAATTRVRAFAASRDLALKIVDAGEFADGRYRANPVNRCYFCKSNLYGMLTRLGAGSAVAAGTNLDDLGDYRPGLQAAKEHGILHPFVEARMDKADIRALARVLDLGDIADLPASPCLASRVETGLRVEPAELAMIDAVETALRASLGEITLRCRRLRTGLAIEIDQALLEQFDADRLAELTALARKASSPLGGGDLAITLRPYRRGSAFLHA
ncbi:adenine nucleotide alpha hydrolase [Paracoccus alkanivorans]|uniref:Adenine nucleotide alpha hydrolase n=1 Tax=Paracoccus alkanivorans TaxID=2116655 RepID=A0A3M0MDF4_9RHOB|nr:adenine nucleotide alpha hydrolase [Paracoccus alkanivorans]RMC35661.1 adenine nucleotide alpha hydrolase [Paracoccus alkanivorans]